MISKHLNDRQINGLLKLGDVVVPGDGVLPGFSETTFVNEIDRMFDYLSDEDREGVAMLLLVFNFIPKFCISWILSLSEMVKGTNIISANLRMLNIGLKGIILTLYYSKIDDKDKFGEKIYHALDWDSKIATKLPEEDSLRQYTDGFISQQVTDQKHDPKMVFALARQAEKELRQLSVAKRMHYISDLKKNILARKWASTFGIFGHQ